MYDFYELSKKELDMMIDVRRNMHMYPEIDRDLPKTSALVEQTLKQLGIEYSKYLNNGIIAEFGCSNPSTRIIALRADMDALEVVDEKTVDYKSKREGYMHACGHDAHTAILLGTAAVLKKTEMHLNGRVRLIFQPAEETDGGAKEMIKYGAVKGVSAILGLHVDENLETGVIGVNKGMVHAASNPFSITVNGKGAHGASPEAGVDSIYIAAKILDNLQGVVSREISATDSAVITIGKFNGGTALNAICSSVKMEGILRTLGKDLRKFAVDRIIKVTEATAQLYRGSATVNFIEGYPSFANDKRLADWFIEMVGSTQIIVTELSKPSMGVEDFAYYTELVPSLFYRLGCKNEKQGIINPAHGGFFDIDEDCMVYGAMFQSKAAFEFLNRSDILL